MSGDNTGNKSNSAPSKSIEELLKLLAMGQELSPAQQKEMKDYKFWKTQPVPSLSETVTEEGPIDKLKTPEDVPNDPLPLISDFEWSTLDIDDNLQLDELYKLLYDNYVEDIDATFRFKYSHEFFQWALKPPGWRKDWHVGVRVKSTGKLVAFIAATPVTFKLNKSNKVIDSVEINFLCIHKKLRNKRLAPVLIKEITRRVNKQNIWQALYTGGSILPTPLTTCRYQHRPINWSKLHDVGFSHLPPNQTKSSMVASYTLPNNPKLKGLRPMTGKDVSTVLSLLYKYQERFDIVQLFTEEEFKHWMLGHDENSDSNVVKSYVVEDENGIITDYFSYYLLPFTVLDNAQHDELGIAYLFYYASDSFEKPNYKKRLNELITDALITSKKFGVDVFNCLTCQDNTYFLKDCKFGSGDGFLNYYLFNYRTFPMDGGIDKKTKEVVEDQTSGIGVVLL
ncbi:glycylpeptide N-tetradecanoyltransferase [Candida albicans P76067]|uniref:Glycylpeptide N-tetradecanoyltransferase n=2 Tax=Candida albicans TaxID=5476 RepID=A0A8H6F3H0_CANAX|nr:myristoyl-CoA:protein N-myristoyltransferase [Candida albicans]KGQ86408.1 glycylpeptide N-tetradecanoyltransferase [Candida albicans P94015]KGQ90104.1 glycylpeptide N-tetradecanoyltransferase [Candida albicans P37005]KGQ97108.1 glycylpeptide N-tetradecanoyltransferase [Candida albicans GC75]KGU07617.1 glycylpeptide N-tetradecanoyltransferase [Candida albicans P87]KGU09131.1 glycylpeptide N-tetradecanoyltransferase [Candida albicans 19F]KGU28284.1 glycylpeptide N-tetradecanoyltransferase [C